MSGYEYLIRCSICGFEAREKLPGIALGDHSKACRVGDDLMEEKGWAKLWLIAGRDVCPRCISKMEEAIVPGRGFELVPTAMIEAGQAFRATIFMEEKRDDKGE